MKSEAVSIAELRRRMDRFHAACERHGVVVTTAREEVYRSVAGSCEHPDVDSVYRQVRRTIPRISLDTVYRAVRLFKDIGLLRAVDAAPDRVRYDADLSQHGHFVCTQCGAAHDLSGRGFRRPRVPENVRALGTIVETRVEFRGICRDCRPEADTKVRSERNNHKP